MSHLAKCLTLLFLVAVVSTLPSGMAIAQHRDAGRFVTYVPVAGANSMDGIEYRDDNVKAGRIFVSPELLAAARVVIRQGQTVVSESVG